MRIGRLFRINRLDTVAALMSIQVDPVTNTKREMKKGNCRPAALNTYSPPKIREFGSVGTLTQAGAGTKIEGGAGNTMRKP